MANKKKDRQYNGQQKEGQAMMYKTLQRKLKIEQHEPHKEQGEGGGWTWVLWKDKQFLIY